MQHTRLIATAVLLIALSVVGRVAAQCGGATELQFKPRNSLYGLQSFITQVGPIGPWVNFEDPVGGTSRPLPPT